jgi:spermidine synthase
MSPQNQVVEKDFMLPSQQLDKYITSTLAMTSRKHRNLGKLFSQRHQVYAHKAASTKGFMSSTYNPSQTQYPQASPGKVLGAGTSRQNYFNQSISNFAVSMDENLDRIGEENL